MKKQLISSSLLALAGAIMMVGCGTPEPAGESAPAATAEGSKLSVYVVNYPLQYFAQRIGGEAAEVVFPAPPDGDPAFWTPDADTIAAYQGADIILLNGATYAKWVDKVTLPSSKMVDTSESSRDRLIFAESGTTHSHGPGGEHSHGEAAFTTWLDPTLAVEQAKAIQKAFSIARPKKEAAFQEGFNSLESDLMALDERVNKAVAGKKNLPLFGSHPVYQYLARRYELKLESVHFEPDEYPDEKAWSELETHIAEHPARWMLWEGEPLDRSVSKLQELGLESVVFDPCGNRPADGNYLSIMRRNVEVLERVFN